jgi:hypothetical protein
VRLVLRPVFDDARLLELLREFLFELEKESTARSRAFRFEELGRELLVDRDSVCGLLLAGRLFGLAWPCEVKDSRVTSVSPMGSCLS